MTNVSAEGEKQLSQNVLLLPVSPCTLPNECRPFKHQLFAENGCYSWKNSHPNLINMIVENQGEGCNDYIILEPIINHESQTQILITAKDESSGQILQCVVKIGLITKLAINTQKRDLFINDAQTIDVIAYDSQGNIFNSLDGLRFDWTIQVGSKHLQLIQKTDSLNSKRTTTLIKGLSAGQAVVNVKLLEPGYEFVKSDSVTISIFDLFVIQPDRLVYLLPTSSFQYGLERLVKQSNGNFQNEPIATLNQKQYKWSVSNSTIGVINQNGTFISGIVEGKDTILVVDQNMNNTAQQDVKVVIPHRVAMSIHDVTFIKKGDQVSLAEAYNIAKDKESESNILVEERDYLILLSVYDKDDNLITLGDNIVFRNYNLLDNKWINTIQTSSTGQEILFRTTKIGDEISRMQTKYTLFQIKSKSGQNYQLNSVKLTIDQELILTKPVKINHATDFIHLPYVQNIGQIWTTSAVGGSGIYKWSVQDPEIIFVSGSVTIKSLKVGETKLIVQDVKNLQNKGFITVQVSNIASLQWLQEQIELEANNNQNITLNLIAVDKDKRKFTNCSSIQVSYNPKVDQSIQITNQTFDYNKLYEYARVEENNKLLILKQLFDENEGTVFANELPQKPVMTEQIILHNNFGICSQVLVEAKSEGLGRVQAKLTSLHENEKMIESEFAEIAVFKPLKTELPKIPTFYQDLYSKRQILQEFQTMDHFFTSKLTLVYGTEIIWSVEGGSNFWKDYQGKYITQFNVVTQDNQSSSKTLQAITEIEKTNRFDIKIKCLQSPDLTQINKLVVNMNQTSKQSRLLLQPKLHLISINVECGAPKQMRLLWSQQQDSVVENLPSSKTIMNQRQHFVLAGSSHTVKALLLNNENIGYLNSSSIILKVSSNDSQLVSVQMAESSFSDAIQNKNYNKRVIQFSNQTGTVEITGEVSYYVNSLLQIGGSQSIFKNPPKDTSEWNLGDVSQFTKISNTLTVQIVQQIQVEPKFKSLYIGKKETFKLTIFGGSGHFLVKQNNTVLAKVNHKDNEILITPETTGMLEIQIEDLQFVDHEPIKAHILISDIEKLYLWAPRYLIEQDEELNLTVSAFDAHGKDFDLDQYQHMKFGIETEMTSLNKQKALTTTQTDVNTVFNVVGSQPGVYQLIAYTNRLSQTKNGKNKIYSEMIKFEIFPQLEIQPNELLIAPNMRYTLQIVGGPSPSAQTIQEGSSIQILFKIEDESIAFVDFNREVVGKRVGDTVLKYQISQQKVQRSYTPRGIQENEQDNKIISKKSVKIRVRFITDIEIPLIDQRQIYVNSLIKMNVVLKHGQEYFNHGIAPISYSWSSANNLIVNLDFPKDNNVIQKSRKIRNNELQDSNAPFTTQFNSSTVYAFANKEGECQVTALLAIQYPDIYQSQKNWFSVTATVKVGILFEIKVNKYSTLVFENTHKFLLPPNSKAYIKTNLGTNQKLDIGKIGTYDHETKTYNFQDSDTKIIELIDNQAIKTFDKYGQLTVDVQMNSNQYSGQVAQLNVEITDIFSLQIMQTYESINFPLGSSFYMPIHFLNEHGNLFADNIEGIQLGVSLSHPGVLKVTVDSFEQKLNIQSIGSGDCNVLVYMVNNKNVFDVFKVKVSSIVRPLSPVYLHVSGEIEFKVINPDNQDAIQDSSQQTSWYSKDLQVLQIDQYTGRAKGLTEGRSEVMLSNHVNTVSIVHVSKIVFGQIDPQSSLDLNTDDPQLQKNSGSEEQKVRIKLYLQKNGEEVFPTVKYNGITLIKQNIGINCSSENQDFIIAKGVVSELEGYFCMLSYNKKSDQEKMPRFIKITVSAFSQLPGHSLPLYNDVITQFEVQLLSQIKVEKKYAQGVSLSKSQKEVNIIVFSSSDFKVNINVDRENKSNDQVYLKSFVSRQDINSNTYNLTLIVNYGVKQDFKATVELTHSYTNQKTLLPVTFYYQSVAPQPKQPKVTKQPSKPLPEFEGITYYNKSWTNNFSFYIILIFIIALLICLIKFVVKNQQQIQVQKQQSQQSQQRQQRSFKTGNSSFIFNSQNSGNQIGTQLDQVYKRPRDNYSYY